MISFTLPLEPVAWERVKRRTNGIAYVPPKTRRFKNEAAWLAKKHAPAKLLDGPLKLTVRFILMPTKRFTRKEPSVRPDLDNYVKALKDALNGVIWTDDSRICRYGEGTGKYYDFAERKPRIEIQIEEIG